MKEKHVVLRSLRAATRDVFLGTRSTPNVAEEALAAGLSVAVEDIERHEIATLNRQDDVLAIAPAMPMKLIRPLTVAETVQPTAQGVAWGVQAVGADTSPFAGDGIVVAVLDTGIDASHAALCGRGNRAKGFYRRGRRRPEWPWHALHGHLSWAETSADTVLVWHEASRRC
jgi:hypothetical protein